MIKAYKYRIYPNAKQAELIDKTIGICRLVYNLGLEIKKHAWQTQRKNVTIYELCSQLIGLKKEYTWMAEVDSQALQASLLKLEKTYNRFFKGQGYPKFKDKKNSSQSYTIRGGTRKINWELSKLTIPKIKNIPIVLSRKFDGDIKIIIISKTRTNKYFASIVVDDELELPNKPTIDISKTIGIDVGLNSFVITSTGKKFDPNRKFKKHLGRLKCLQKRASRKQNGSKNKKKSFLKISRLHEKISNDRNDYIHKITNTLISDNQADGFVIEKLNVSGLIKNRTLSQAISDASFGKFFEVLKYKCEWYGKNLIVIDQFAPSTKRCSICGCVNNKLTLDDRNWACGNCNETHDRDLNAAKNILWFGTNGINSPEGIRGEPVELR